MHRSAQQQGGDCVFRLLFLGKEGLNRPNRTGFGSVQKSLRSLYLGHIASSAVTSPAKSAEKTVIIDDGSLHFRYWDSGARQFQQDSVQFDSVIYLELVFFHTVKGRKRHFGYFRRHSDASDVIPDSVLIPLHRKDHKLLTKMEHKPLICMVLRKPFGMHLLECQLLSVESESVGLTFVQEFDLRNRARQEPERRQNFLNHAPWFGRDARSSASRWQSQPSLLLEASNTVSSEDSEPLLSRESTTSRQQQQQEPELRKAGSQGTILDKYKELQQFNISEYDYMHPAELEPPQLPPRKSRGAQRSGSFAQASASPVPPPRPVARVSPTRLAGGVRVLPDLPVDRAASQEKPMLVNPHKIRRHSVKQQQQQQQRDSSADPKLAEAELQRELDSINLQLEAPVNFTTALGYLP